MKPRIWNRGDLRLLVVGLAFVVAWTGIGYRLFDLQGAQAARMASVGFDQRIKTQPIPAARGTIYDRDGVELAMTINGYNVVVDPQLLDDTAEAAAVLAPFSELDEDALASELAEAQASGSRYSEIAMRVPTTVKTEIAAAVDDADLTGVFYRKQPLRVYPAGSVAAQVIGLTRYDDGAGI
ncbi:MAG: hypothetical protein M3094_02280, partial [Actinomycetia bacterium]|nr:hypothetical protein [Actinomycetes bacterium]